MFGSKDVRQNEGSFPDDFDSSSNQCGVRQDVFFLTEDLEETISRYKTILDSSCKKSKIAESNYEANDLSKDLYPINKIHKRKYSNIDQQESSKYETKRKHENDYLRDDILWNRKLDGFLKNKENPPKKKEAFYDYKYRSRGLRKSQKQNYLSDESSEYNTCKYLKKHKISKSQGSARTWKNTSSHSKSKSSKHHHSDSESDIEFYKNRRREIKRRISEIEDELKKYSDKYSERKKDCEYKESKRRVKHSPKIVDNNLDEKKNPKSNQDNKLFDGSEKEYYCYVCQLDLNGIDCYENHMKGKRHQKALNAQLLRPEALLYPAEGNHSKNPLFRKDLRNKRYKWKKITVMESRTEYNGSSAEETDPSKRIKRRFNKSDSNTAWSVDENGEFYCEICDAHMNNESMLNAHMVGKRHLKNEKKIRYGWFW